MAVAYHEASNSISIAPSCCFLRANFESNHCEYFNVKSVRIRRRVRICRIVHALHLAKLDYFADHLWIKKRAIACQTDNNIGIIEFGSLINSVENIDFTASVTVDIGDLAPLGNYVIARQCRSGNHDCIDAGSLTCGARHPSYGGIALNRLEYFAG